MDLPPSTSDTIPQLAIHLAHRSLSHIPPAYRPTHLHSPTPARSFSSCFFEHFTFRLRSYESEAVPIFHGSAPVLDNDITAETRISTLSPHSPTLRKLFLFQKRLPRRPNCALTFGLCACGHIHAHLHALQPLSANTPLHVGDPPYHESDFVLQFDGGAYRTLGIGGAGVVLWQHTRGSLVFIDSLCLPLYPCPDAAHAEAAGAAAAVLLAAKHYPTLRPSRILIKGDNRAVIDFMTHTGKYRRPDLQQALQEAHHLLAFRLPPCTWCYTPREFNKCANFLAGIARDHAREQLSSPPAAPRAMDVDTNASSTSPAHDFPHQPVDDDTKRMLIAPLVIPSRSPKPSSLPTTTSAEKQSLLTCYAGLFARLPSLGQILNSQFHHAQELYNHLFAPSVPVANPDNPNSAFHQSTPPRDSSTPISNPFSDLVDSFVDLPSSLEDIHNMSRPTAPPLTLANPSTQQPAPTYNFTPLLNFLADTLNPHIAHLASQPTHSCFVILVVGPSTHTMAGPALHSHLVSSVTIPGDDVSVIYVPTDLIQGFSETTAWHPLLVYTTAALAYPDLPFLVVTPDYSAGATTSPDSLRKLLSPADSMVVFSSSQSIISPDVLLHLPPPVKLNMDESMPDATAPSTTLPKDFRVRTADELQSLIFATTTLHLSSHASRREDLIDPVQRDLHFPLFCTPYYGFVPDDMTDFHIELFQLACHLVRATPPLLDVWDGNTLPSPSSLLATLAALFPERITTVPGEGVFLRPYSDPDGENPPQSCWLNYAPGPTPFAPAHFHHLESTLTAHSSNSPLPMFSSAIPLGPSACVYLNRLLPPPRLAPPGDLVIKNDATPDPHCGGWGAIQYYDSGAIPLLTLQPPTFHRGPPGI